MGFRRVRENWVFDRILEFMGSDGLIMGFRWVNYGLCKTSAENPLFGT